MSTKSIDIHSGSVDLSSVHPKRRPAGGAEIRHRDFIADLNVADDLGFKNANLREQYLRHHRLYTSSEIRNLSRLATPAAARWKRGRRIFGVPIGRQDRYPAFQFIEGKPRPEIARILSELPIDMSPWQIALWFASKNGWVEDDEAPENALHDMDGILKAVADLASDEVG